MRPIAEHSISEPITLSINWSLFYFVHLVPLALVALALALPCCSAAGSKADMAKIVKQLENLSKIDWVTVKALIDSKQVQIDRKVMFEGKSADIAGIVNKLVHISKIDWAKIGQLMAMNRLSFDDTIIVNGEEVNTSRVVQILDYFGKIDWKSFGTSIGNNFVINLFIQFAPDLGTLFLIYIFFMKFHIQSFCHSIGPKHAITIITENSNTILS